MDEYDLNWIWKAYAASQESDDPEILANALGVPQDRFQELSKSWEPLANAIVAGAQKRASMDPVSELIDEETKATWALISGNDAEARQLRLIELSNDGEIARQKMFIAGLMESYYDVPKVCKALGIGKKTFDQWKRNPVFLEMLEAVNWAKRGFAEASLMKLVAQGSEKSVIEANRALNREVYGEKLEVSGQINHAHAVVSIDALDLPMETRLAILDATKRAGLIDSDGIFIEDKVN